MARYRLYLFSEENGERETVVISKRGYQAVCKLLEGKNLTFHSALDIAGNALFFPCDRMLCLERA